MQPMNIYVTVVGLDLREFALALYASFTFAALLFRLFMLISLGGQTSPSVACHVNPPFILVRK